MVLASLTGLGRALLQTPSDLEVHNEVLSLTLFILQKIVINM